MERLGAPPAEGERSASGLIRQPPRSRSAAWDHFPAWFNFSIFAGDKSWVAGVELATASGPQRGSLGSGGVDPSHPEV